MTQSKLLQHEAMRQREQNAIDASKAKKDRNKMGQFSTPRHLADELLTFAKKRLESRKIQFFDPAFGMGSFYAAFIKEFGINAKALGFETDSDYYSASKKVWSAYKNLTLREADFTTQTPGSFGADLIVCNPPYIRHQHIQQQEKQRLQQLSEKVSGQKISGLAGMHAYFVLLTHAWLKEHGLAIWLVPSEILEVNYGRSIREYLLGNVSLERIHFFDHANGKFDDALVSSCIIVYRKEAPTNGTVAITSGDSFASPISQKHITRTRLENSDKWSKYLLESDSKATSTAKKTLGDFFLIKRGIATGNNEFFILDKERALELEVPRQYLRNILPSSRYLPEHTVRFDEDGFLAVEKKYVLLDIDLPLAQIKSDYPKLYGYLLAGMDQGFHESYLTSRRTPWYSQEKREPAKFFVRYMNRETKNSDGLHPIFIKNEADAIATNSYLMLYEKPAGLFDSATSDTELWDILKVGLDKAMYQYGRTYGGGLVKFEPNELKNIPIALEN
jgi:hypothetical protein